MEPVVAPSMAAVSSTPPSTHGIKVSLDHTRAAPHHPSPPPLQHPGSNPGPLPMPCLAPRMEGAAPWEPPHPGKGLILPGHPGPATALGRRDPQAVVAGPGGATRAAGDGGSRAAAGRTPRDAHGPSDRLGGQEGAAAWQGGLWGRARGGSPGSASRHKRREELPGLQIPRGAG